MQTNDTPEREIDIRCLFWTIVSRWRLALLCALIGAVLLGGFGAYRYLRSHRTAEAPPEEALIGSMSKEEATAVERLAVQYRGFLEYGKRLQDGGIFDLNPYDVARCEILYYIDADAITDPEHGEVVRTYNADLQNALRKRMTSADVRETVAGMLGTTVDMLSNFFWASNAGSSSFLVAVLSPDAEKAEQVTEYVKGVIEAYSEEMQTLIGRHTLHILSEDMVRQFESSLESLRNNNMTTYDRIEADEKKQVEEMTGTQQALFRIRKEQIDAEFGLEAEEDEQAGGSLLNKKYIVLGFAAGFFLACLWVLLKEVLGGRLQSPEDVNLFTGGYVGRIPAGQYKGLDAWIRARIRGTNARLTREESEEAAVAELAAICRAQGLSTLAVVCTADEPVRGRADAFAKKLSAAGLAGAEDGAQAVVFYEAAGVSRADRLTEAVRLAGIKNQTVIGSVVEY